MINFVPDIATLQKIASAEDAIFIVQDTTVNKAFRWIEKGSSLTVDGVDILTTRRGGNTRWLSLSAKPDLNNGFFTPIGAYSVEYTDDEDPTTGLFPSTGGSGTSGAIKEGDGWIAADAQDGTEMAGLSVKNGNTLLALSDSPGQDPENWLVVPGNLGYTAENAANKKTTIESYNSGEYPESSAVRNYFRDIVRGNSSTVSDGSNITEPVVPSVALAAGEHVTTEIIVQLTSTSGASAPRWGRRKVLVDYWADASGQRSYSARVIDSENSDSLMQDVTIEGAFTSTGTAGVPAIKITNASGVSVQYKFTAKSSKDSGLLGTDAASIAETLYHPDHMVGQVSMVFQATAPKGMVALTGANLSRTTYRRLFQKWGTTFGAGDGSTTFGTPDPRGLVPVFSGAHGSMTRASGAAYDGGSPGATRNDQMQRWKVSKVTKDGLGGPPDSFAYGGNTTGPTISMTPEADGTNGTPRTGDETRPAEIAALCCVVY